jgi:hypothetical protein
MELLAALFPLFFLVLRLEDGWYTEEMVWP